MTVASQIWDFELFAVQDNIEVDGQIISGKRSVTVDKVVTALAILIVGYWFAVRLSRLLENQAVIPLGHGCRVLPVLHGAGCCFLKSCSW